MAVFNPSNGQTPFGFALTRHDKLLVTEAFGGGPAEARVSSYNTDDTGELSTISHSVGTTQVAACWILLSRHERFAYTTNTPSQRISSFRVARDGTLTLLQGVAGVPGENPVDMATSKNGRFLYTLNSGDGTISAFRLRANGSLYPIGSGEGLPDGANGLVAW